MSDRRWLDGSPDPTDVELRRALDDAQERLGDDVALRRVWSKLSQATSPALKPRPPRRWRWFVGGVASSAGLAAVLAIAFWPERAPAPIAVAQVPAARQAGAAAADTILRPTPPAASLQRRALAGPATVETAAGETLALALPGGVAASVGPGSRLTVDAKQRPIVDAGDVHFSVPHQAPGDTFVVLVGVYRVVVVGTKFRVHNGDRVRVEVDDGVVEIWRETVRLARLTVGESWTGESPAVAAVVAGESAARGRVTPGRPGARARKRPAALAVLNPEPDSADNAATLPLPEADAEEALAAGDVRRELELYGEILARGGPASENAAYEIGKVLRDRLHQPEAAVAAWRRYRNANANGILRVEADVSIIETLMRLGDGEGALAEATRFLRDHPDSERRDEIARIAGDLQRASGDCRSAIRSYELALQTSQRSGLGLSGLVDRASFGRAACLRAARDGGAAGALRQYLDDFPAGLFRADAVRLIDEIGKTSR